MEKEAILSYKPFSAAKDSSAVRLLAQSSVVSLDAGEEIECKNALGLVLDGEINVRGLDGGRKMLYRTISTGEVFGAAQIFGGEGAYTSLTAKKRCAVAMIPERTIRELVMTDGDFACAFSETLCEKLRILNRKLSALSSADATAALCKVLLAASKGENGKVGTGSRTELAARLGISRMTLYRILCSLEKSGAVSIEEKSVIINDKDALKALV